MGRGARRQCFVATDRANTPATSRQFERGSAIHGQIHACDHAECPGQNSKVWVRVIHRSINFCIMTEIRTGGARYVIIIDECRMAPSGRQPKSKPDDLSSRGGDWTSLLGPGEPYTPNSEKDTSCLGPAEPYAPSTYISELIVLAHIGKKVRAQGTANHPRRPGLPFRYTCDYGYIYHA